MNEIVATPVAPPQPPPASPSRRHRLGAFGLSVDGQLVALLGLLVALVVWFYIQNTLFLSWANVMNVGDAIAVIGLLAAGETLVILAGGLDISVGATAAVAGVVAAVLMLHGWPAVPAIVMAVAAGLILGGFNGFCVNVLRVNPVITTLGTLQLFKGIAFFIEPDQKPVGVRNSFFQKLGTGRVFRTDNFPGIPVSFLFMLAIGVIVWVFLTSTDIGRNVYAVGGNERAARLSGHRHPAGLLDAVHALGRPRGDGRTGHRRPHRFGQRRGGQPGVRAAGDHRRVPRRGVDVRRARHDGGNAARGAARRRAEQRHEPRRHQPVLAVHRPGHPAHRGGGGRRMAQAAGRCRPNRMTRTTPLYTAIADAIEGRIRCGEWSVGTRLPAERTFCEQLDVSRTTLRDALDDLEQRGLISRHQGRGTFVARPPTRADLGSYFSIGAALASQGKVLTSEVLQFDEHEASRQTANELALLPGASVARLNRVRSVDGEPLYLETTWLSLERFPGLLAHDPRTHSLYEILRTSYGCHVVAAVAEMIPVILTPAESALLGVHRNLPALSLHRVTRDGDERPVEVSEALLRGDRARFVQHLRVGPSADTRPVEAMTYAFGTS